MLFFRKEFILPIQSEIKACIRCLVLRDQPLEVRGSRHEVRKDDVNRELNKSIWNPKMWIESNIAIC
jgi:hypothetical protein